MIETPRFRIGDSICQNWIELDFFYLLEGCDSDVLRKRTWIMPVSSPKMGMFTILKMNQPLRFLLFKCWPIPIQQHDRLCLTMVKALRNANIDREDEI